MKNAKRLPVFVRARIGLTIKHRKAERGPTKHRKELQGTFKPSKCLKTLQGTTRYFYSNYNVVKNSTRKYKVLLNQVQSSWKHYKELQGTYKPSTR